MIHCLKRQMTWEVVALCPHRPTLSHPENLSVMVKKSKPANWNRSAVIDSNGRLGVPSDRIGSGCWEGKYREQASHVLTTFRTSLVIQAKIPPALLDGVSVFGPDGTSEDVAILLGACF